MQELWLETQPAQAKDFELREQSRWAGLDGNGNDF
jgi:hypothetical protein